MFLASFLDCVSQLVAFTSTRKTVDHVHEMLVAFISTRKTVDHVHEMLVAFINTRKTVDHVHEMLSYAQAHLLTRSLTWFLAC